MTTVYRLKDDQRFVEQVQRATQTTERFGIQPTHGMFGSEVWWQNIESGQLPLQTLKGTIKEVYMGSMGDWPEFKMVSETGEESTWTRMVRTPDQDKVYRVGVSVEIDFVWQQHRPKSWDNGAQIRQVVEIRLEDT